MSALQEAIEVISRMRGQPQAWVVPRDFFERVVREVAELGPHKEPIDHRRILEDAAPLYIKGVRLVPQELISDA